MQPLIITADDFGASPNVNEGVYQALEAKAINTVSALMNMPNSVEDVQKLRERFPTVPIGVHLTITSGAPVLGEAAAVLCKEPLGKQGKWEFQDLGELDFEHIVNNQRVLRHELTAQIERLKEAIGTIDHVSVHHGTLTFHQNLIEEYRWVADTVAQAPLRNPVIISRENVPGFHGSIMKLEGLFRGLRLLDDNWHIRKQLWKQLQPTTVQGQLTGATLPRHTIDVFYGQASKMRLKRIMKHLPRTGISELMVHLSASPTADRVTNGINPKYYRGRYRELSVLLKNQQVHEYMRRYQVVHGSFQDLPD